MADGTSETFRIVAGEPSPDEPTGRTCTRRSSAGPTETAAVLHADGAWRGGPGGRLSGPTRFCPACYADELLERHVLRDVRRLPGRR